MPIYVVILFCTAAFPFALSFDRNLQFYKQWKYLFPALVPVALVYIIFDIFLTRAGVWGFNPSYLAGPSLFGLPVEEWLFFIIIPYASIFLHDVIAYYFPTLRTGPKTAKWITITVILASIAIILLFPGKIYTNYSAGMVILALLLSFFDKKEEIRRFYFTFLIILIPFMAVNGILTGSLIANEVVWYNPEELTGIRIFTIPAEDTGYAFSMILMVLLLRNGVILRAKKRGNQNG